MKFVSLFMIISSSYDILVNALTIQNKEYVVSNIAAVECLNCLMAADISDHHDNVVNYGFLACFCKEKNAVEETLCSHPVGYKNRTQLQEINWWDTSLQNGGFVSWVEGNCLTSSLYHDVEYGVKLKHIDGNNVRDLELSNTFEDLEENEYDVGFKKFNVGTRFNGQSDNILSLRFATSLTLNQAVTKITMPTNKTCSEMFASVPYNRSVTYPDVVVLSSFKACVRYLDVFVPNYLFTKDDELQVYLSPETLSLNPEIHFTSLPSPPSPSPTAPPSPP